MIYFGYAFALIILAVMIYMALNTRSNRQVRIACLAALAVMILTIIICLFLLLIPGKDPVDESIVIVNAPPPLKKTMTIGNILIMLVFSLFLIVLFIIVATKSLHDNKKSAKKPAW